MPKAKPKPDPDQTRKARLLLSPQEYGEVLRAARLKAGWPSGAEAARAAGIRRTRLVQLETGERVPSWQTLHQLVLALHLDPRLLFPAPKPEPANGKPRSKAKPKRPR